MSNKTILFGIFAHPDDESFGCAGTFLKEINEGADAQLILLTDGSAGENPDDVNDIGKTRLAEWRAGYELMGVSKGHYLGYHDGKLTNDTLQLVNEQVIDIITNETKGYDTIDIIAFDMGGLSGHIDHIVASRAAAYAFYTLKKRGFPMGRLRLRCLQKSDAPSPSTDWLFAEAGREANEIGEIIDAREYNDKILDVIACHHTQRSDAAGHIERLGENIGLNPYIIWT